MPRGVLPNLSLIGVVIVHVQLCGVRFDRGERVGIIEEGAERKENFMFQQMYIKKEERLAYSLE